MKQKSELLAPLYQTEKAKTKGFATETFDIRRADVDHASHELIQDKKILEKKQIELKGSEEMLRGIIESTADGILVTDENGRILCYNQLYQDMWPIPSDIIQAGTHQVVLQYCSDYMKDPQQFLVAAMKIYAEWPPESFHTLLLNSGRVFERYSKAKPVSRQHIGRVWSFRDITERRRAEAYTAQLAAIVESSNDAIIVKDLNGIINNWNAGAERLFGYRKSEILGHSITDLIPLDRLDEETRIMSLIKSGKFTDHFETVRLRKGGKTISVSIMISPVKDGAGNIIGASKVARDISQLKESQERIQHLANYDELTELPNRRLLADRMNIAIAHAARCSGRLALLFLDLDRFKPVNDSLGHDVGDKLLKAVAERMQGMVRLTDTTSRFGGDEFIILLSQIDVAENAACVAEKLLMAVSRPYKIGGHVMALTASIGIAIYPEHGKEPSTLLRKADISMYAAKKAGRNQYRFYDEEMTSRTAERINSES
ncbi:MAG: diguanylate cyclase [Nitrosospira sp.]